MTASTTSSTGCAERKLAAIDKSRNSGAEFVVGQVVGAPLELAPGIAEALRVGALEGIDRLLEVADHEQGAVAALALARATEIFGDELLDDLPLRRVGVLRLVDQHMVDFAVELVTHPVAHARRPQQARVQSIRSLKSATPAARLARV